jgi:hypothetical protein
MARYHLVLSEVATGKVRRADMPATRYQTGGEGSIYAFFDTENEALRFKDEILRQFPDLEVLVRVDPLGSGAIYSSDGGSVAFTSP